MAHAFALRCDVIYAAAMVAMARRRDAAKLQGARDRLAGAEDALVAHAAAAVNTPMTRLADRLALTPLHQEFLWTAAAARADPRLVVPLEYLGGAKGAVSAVAFATIHRLDTAIANELIAWLDDPDNSLVRAGLLIALDDRVPIAARPFATPGRVCAALRGVEAPAHPVASVPVSDTLLMDPEGQRALEELARILAQPEEVVVVVEGPVGSGRRTAIAHAAGGRATAVVDAAAIRMQRAREALLELRSAAFLAEALPVVADVHTWDTDEPGSLGGQELAAILDRWPGSVALTTSQAGIDVGTRKPTVRVRWPVPRAPLRRELWATMGAREGVPPKGDLHRLAHRYELGPGGIARAVATARALLAVDERLDEAKLAAGVRHNIAERIGGLARRIDVTQRWDELVVADDVRDQLEGLIARVRYAPQVLESWGYAGKLARGAGVAALFSGPPGTGKSMCAGLIARELDLELYMVDLSQVVSKWVGETEKQLDKVFDAAEEGHALLLFDEADALFGQRSTEIKGATDRYANLEVNFLLQRIEAFGGITILTTNLDASIDRALKRRLAAHIVFEAPDEDERATLWTQLTQTGAAPLARDVDVEELARDYPKMTGAHIRNAALGAAFLAASAESSEITQETLHRAARAEYRAMGHVLAQSAGGGRSSLR